MAKYLPVKPPAKQSWRLISATNILSPAFGGDDLELRRKGSKYEFTFDYGEVDYLESLDWSDLDVEGETVVAVVWQPGLDTGEPGSPRVSGGGQIGSVLKLKGVSPGYQVRKGQFLSVHDGGVRHFMYRASAAVVAAPDGTMNVPLYTLLRHPHAGDSVVDIREPKVEGYPRDVSDREVYDNHNVKLSFKIRERG
ncbi:hypothetical protein [Brevundimonas sp.]|uniref:hypothetical protein n=1 Tax=Brevundimonas sp. TaxID=1871086 RepID=UPI0028A10467|nr:hypothetical protein [Brevundimonas sp.]